jgi:hypothetical protein
LSVLPAFLHFVENRLTPAPTLFHSLLGGPTFFLMVIPARVRSATATDDDQVIRVAGAGPLSQKLSREPSEQK